MALGASGVEVTARLTRDNKIAQVHNLWLPDGRWVSNCTFAELPNGTLELSTYLYVVAGHGMNIMVQSNPQEPFYDPTSKVADVVVSRVIAVNLTSMVLIQVESHVDGPHTGRISRRWSSYR